MIRPSGYCSIKVLTSATLINKFFPSSISTKKSPLGTVLTMTFTTIWVVSFGKAETAAPFFGFSLPDADTVEAGVETTALSSAENAELAKKGINRIIARAK